MNTAAFNPRNSLCMAMLLLAVGCSTGAKNGGRAKAFTNPDQQQNGIRQSTSNVGPAASTTGQPSAASDNGQASAVKGQAVAEPGAPAAPAPSKPAAASLSVPAGTVLHIRLTQALRVKKTSTGQGFTGTVVDGVSSGGVVVISAGSAVQGDIVRAHRRGRFKGSSVLQLRLTGLDVGNHHYRIETRSFSRHRKGKGRRTAAFIGGGSGLGMLIGGVATGGVGLLVGGLTGAGAGAAGAAFTGNRDITLPAESVITFRLAQPLLLR